MLFLAIETGQPFSDVLNWTDEDIETAWEIVNEKAKRQNQ